MEQLEEFWNTVSLPFLLPSQSEICKTNIFASIEPQIKEQPQQPPHNNNEGICFLLNLCDIPNF